MAANRLAAAQRTLLTHRWIANIKRLAGRLEDLNPNRILARGYSRTVLQRTGRTLTRAADARPGDLLQTHLAEGELASRVTGAAAPPGEPPKDPRPGAADSRKPNARPGKTGRGPQATLFGEEP
jgi:hypothetical protein